MIDPARAAMWRPHGAAWVAVLLALAASAVPAAAQTVLVRVLNAETSAPVFGAVTHLVDDRGEVVRSVLSDAEGRALFARVDLGRYRARAEMIGMATLESEPFDVLGASTEPRELRLVPRAIDLEAIDVRAERRRCVARPTEEGLAVATLWSEARKALAAAAITDRQGLYRYEIMTYERDVDPRSGVVVRSDAATRQGYTQSPFESLPPEDLVGDGFVQQDGAELVYYAPDAGVLLSDAFLDTHCFRLDESSDEEGVIGLEFEPVGRRRVPDIGGTLWLDRQSAELRWLEYTYFNLDLEVRSATAGGRVEFQRMPAGTWIVPEWWIEMPILGTDMADRGSPRTAVTRVRRSGGRVLEVHEAGGRPSRGRAGTGGIEGIVVDSAGAPVAGARVGAIGWNQESFTDAQGAFTLLGMPEGTYEVRAVDPRWAGLGLEPPLVTREVIPGEVSYIQLHLPKVGDLLRTVCPDLPERGGGVLVGRVLDSTGRPLSGATVQVVWSSFGADPGGGLREISNGLETTTDADGAYRLCGVALGRRLEVMSRVGEAERSAGSLTIGEGEVGTLFEIRRRD
jgi:hypothetical protein